MGEFVGEAERHGVKPGILAARYPHEFTIKEVHEFTIKE
jgi:hypothetical protein